MHKIISIETFELTRIVVAKNLHSGTIDICFDDSELVSEENFDFIQIGRIYNLKIKLIGSISIKLDEKALKCSPLSLNVYIGKQEMIKIRAEEDEYYLQKKKYPTLCGESDFSFHCTRKDIIQVDNIIHADYLKNTR